MNWSIYCKEDGLEMRSEILQCVCLPACLPVCLSVYILHRVYRCCDVGGKYIGAVGIGVGYSRLVSSF